MLLISGLLAGCGGSGPPDGAALSADVPLHLERHLDAAEVEGSVLPEQPPTAREWRFDEPRPEWQPIGFGQPRVATGVGRIEDGIRITLRGRWTSGAELLHGGVFVELPDWNLEDWAYVVVKLRAAEPLIYDEDVQLRLELDTDTPATNDQFAEVLQVRMLADGTDSDGDGMTDRFESRYGVSSATADSDGDGLS
ncbi:MAG: hypothetical protein R3190_11700, partial [Thermoanaerobaculia bacterium]|nr:hypothetical protein [Thermoanaerobaculia bacterium]